MKVFLLVTVGRFPRGIKKKKSDSLVFSRKNPQHKQSGVDLLLILQVLLDPVEKMRKLLRIIRMDNGFETLTELHPAVE